MLYAGVVANCVSAEVCLVHSSAVGLLVCCGAGNSPMGPEQHQVTLNLIVRISRVKAGQPQLTTLVVSVDW